MAKLTKLNPLAATIGAAFVASAMLVPVAQASQTTTSNPFAASDLSQGYQVADNMSGDKKAEGSCGANKDKKAEGSCGANKAKMDKKAEGSCGANKAKMDKKAEGSCGASKS